MKRFELGILLSEDFEFVQSFTDYLWTRKNNKLPKLPFTFVCDLFDVLNDKDCMILKKAVKNK